ncbi:NAD dependent epimerase/dehydratase [Lophium mytilinum]|uniref:NAD dependent epimerase/dehydratase n=1 Tax=Lophium mytilinum TaxID=390894 RepID=A0A6A6QLS1_9PEZI|nr:NAD dependent epimerase/dehydratase [Lophium mytilinum]
MGRESSCNLLITGATGHVGFRTLIHALNAGYTVRAAVRSQAKANIIINHPQIKALNLGSRLSFIIVPEITYPYAYDEATRGVKYVIHIASPLMTGGDEIPLNEHDSHFIQPAVLGTLSMLEAAKKSQTVRRVVITSSVVAITPVAQMEGYERRSTPVLPTDRVVFESGPYETEFAAYANSKVAALQEAEAWIKREKPSFDVIHLHPAFIEGRNDLATTPREAMKGTNAVVLGIALGKDFGGFAGATVHNDDVARVHVQSLLPQIPGNRSYILSQQTRWDDAKDIIKRAFPDAVAKRRLPNCGSAHNIDIKFDSSLTERTFGFKHIGFEEQVKSVVGHFLEIRSRRRTTMQAASSDRRGSALVAAGQEVRANA